MHVTLHQHTAPKGKRRVHDWRDLIHQARGHLENIEILNAPGGAMTEPARALYVSLAIKNLEEIAQLLASESDVFGPRDQWGEERPEK